MNIYRPFTNVFKDKSIYRGSDWVQDFALRDVVADGGQSTDVNLSSYTVKMAIKPYPNTYDWNTNIEKNFTPSGNEFTLSLLSAEQLNLIPDFETSGLNRPMYAQIEVELFNANEHIILIRDDIAVYPTVRGDA